MIETIILICFVLLLLLAVDVIATPNRNKKHILSVTSLDRGTSSERDSSTFIWEKEASFL